MSDHSIQQLEANCALVYVTKTMISLFSLPEYDQDVSSTSTTRNAKLVCKTTRGFCNVSAPCDKSDHLIKKLEADFALVYMKHMPSLFFYHKFDPADSSATWNAKLACKTRELFATSVFDMYTSQHLVIRVTTS